MAGNDIFTRMIAAMNSLHPDDKQALIADGGTAALQRSLMRGLTRVVEEIQDQNPRIAELEARNDELLEVISKLTERAQAAEQRVLEALERVAGLEVEVRLGPGTMHPGYSVVTDLERNPDA